MDQTGTLQTVLKHSRINVKETLKSLAAELKSHLKKDFSLYDSPAACQNLSVLAEFISCTTQQYDIDSKGSDEQEVNEAEQVRQIVSDIVNQVCLPLLPIIQPSVDSRSEMLIFLGKVGSLLTECANFHPDCLAIVLNQIEVHLADYLKEKPTTFDLQSNSSLVDVHTILDVLLQVLNRISRQRDLVSVNNNTALFRRLFSLLTEALDIISVDLAATKCIPVLVRLMKFDLESIRANLLTIWKITQDFFQNDEMRKVFLLLCGFANYFFPTGDSVQKVDIRGNDLFWHILQSGLYSKDSVNRKRALYLLKRIVDVCERLQADVNTDGMFWWSQECTELLSKTWEDFMLLAEVFEEKQVYICVFRTHSSIFSLYISFIVTGPNLEGPKTLSSLPI